MNALTDIALGTASSAASKAIVPWLCLAAIMALGSAGAAGMYAGYEVANARYADEQKKLLVAFAEASTAQKEALKESRRRGDEATGMFLQELRAMTIVNTTINKEVQREIQRTVYTDCKLPDSGAALLIQHVDDVNLKLLESDQP